jgi:hypothetical protein
VSNHGVAAAAAVSVVVVYDFVFRSDLVVPVVALDVAFDIVFPQLLQVVAAVAIARCIAAGKDRHGVRYHDVVGLHQRCQLREHCLARSSIYSPPGHRD